MKRSIIILFLALVLTSLSLSLLSCDSENETAGTDTSSVETETGTEDTADGTTVTEEETTTRIVEFSFDKNGFSDIKIASHTNYKTIYIDVKSDASKLLSLSIPEEWTLKKADTGYTVSRKGVEIGHLYFSDVKGPQYAEVMENLRQSKQGIVVVSQILADPDATTQDSRFLRRLAYSVGGESICTLITNYCELNKAKLYKESQYIDATEDPGFNVASLENARRNRPILILGNSFIGSSDIGEQFNQMIEASGVDYDRYAIARSVGYATVSKSWDDYLSNIESGSYSAVVMCGFYEGTDVVYYKNFFDACQKSNTIAIIFPAHNESYGNSAHKKYPDAIYLDWKGEIDKLIKVGVPRSEFCINDAHSHSTPLAGYIGASMLFRALYGQVPPESVFRQVHGSTRYQVIKTYVKEGSLSYKVTNAYYSE